MISASHNPYFDNGIKLINTNGEKMDEGTVLRMIGGQRNVCFAAKTVRSEIFTHSTPENYFLRILFKKIIFSFLLLCRLSLKCCFRESKALRVRARRRAYRLRLRGWQLYRT